MLFWCFISPRFRTCFWSDLQLSAMLISWHYFLILYLVMSTAKHLKYFCVVFLYTVHLVLTWLKKSVPHFIYWKKTTNRTPKVSYILSLLFFVVSCCFIGVVFSVFSRLSVFYLIITFLWPWDFGYIYLTTLTNLLLRWFGHLNCDPWFVSHFVHCAT